MPRVLHWFRNDLRVADNPALFAAAEAAQGELLTCFLCAPAQWYRHDWGDLRQAWLLDNLLALRSELAERNIPLLILSTESFDEQPQVLARLLGQLQAKHLTFNEEYAVNERKRDREVIRCLRDQGHVVERYRDQSIAPVGSVLTAEEKPYSVFSPFKRRWWQQSEAHWHSPLKAPPRQQPIQLDAQTAPLAQAEPERSYLSARACRLAEQYSAGEAAAHERLERFLATAGGDYDSQRNFPAIDGTSRLSPYLALGVLSGRQCLQAAWPGLQSGGAGKAGFSSWVNELIWRDFYIHVLYHFPHVSRHRAFRAEFENAPWEWEGERFQAWCEARTGVPIVDAAMRQLLQTGWMHNRLRMVVAMFLTKNLNVHWRLGERFFMQHLIDGYLPANNGGWQWSASTGTDAAPYFRIFNPVSQSRKFDPDGTFLDHFLPELQRLPLNKRHEPLSAPVDGIDYPVAMVDLKESRKEAIALFKQVQADSRQSA